MPKTGTNHGNPGPRDRPSWTGDSKRTLEIGREFVQRLANFCGLLAQGRHHSLGHLRFVADQFEGGHNQRQIVVDVVTHDGQLAVQLVHLRHSQGNWFTRQTHFSKACAENEARRKPLPLPDTETAAEDHLGERDQQEDAAHDGVEPEKRGLDPIQAALARDPMFEHEASDDDEPTHEIGDFEAAQQSEQEQQAAHEHMG